MKVHTSVMLTLGLLLASPGCSSVQTAFSEGLPQEVTVLSYPSGAEVWINDELMGSSPVTVRLGRKVPHKVELRKDGYYSKTRFFVPQANEKHGSFVKLGLLADIGYYNELTPEAMAEIMDHELVPKTVSARPFEEMTRRIVEADKLLAQGQLQPLEHKILANRIVEFYSEWN